MKERKQKKENMKEIKSKQKNPSHKKDFGKLIEKASLHNPKE